MPCAADVTAAGMVVVLIIVLKIAVDTTFVKKDGAGFTAVIRAALI